MGPSWTTLLDYNMHHANVKPVSEQQRHIIQVEQQSIYSVFTAALYTYNAAKSAPVCVVNKDAIPTPLNHLYCPQTLGR